MKRSLLLLGVWFFALSCANVTRESGEFQNPVLPKESFLFIRHSVEFKICVEKSCTSVDARSVGSGFVVATDGTDSWGITAGHLCTVPKAEVMGATVHIVSDIQITLFEGEKHSAEIEAIYPESDICVLRIKDAVLEPVSLSKKAPRYGEKAYTTSAPYAVFEPGMLPKFDGYYSGTLKELLAPDGSVTYKNLDAYGLPTRQGSSGAPIFNAKGELTGMTILSLRNLEHYCYSPAYADLRDVILKLWANIIRNSS
jgi:S1-C subfamily serine protease